MSDLSDLLGMGNGLMSANTDYLTKQGILALLQSAQSGGGMGGSSPLGGGGFMPGEYAFGQPSKFEQLARIISTNLGKYNQAPTIETANIGGHNILVNRPNQPMNKAFNALAGLSTGYVNDQVQQRRLTTQTQFKKDLAAALNEQDPQKQLSSIMAVGTNYGGFMGLDDQIKNYTDAMSKIVTNRNQQAKSQSDQKRKDLIDSTKIREEFINRPEVKDYVLVNTQVKSMDSLLQEAKAGNVKNKVALDQALITMYNKLTDPTSVVRESEYARTPENLPMVNRFSGAMQKIERGGAGLTDKDREALVWGAKVIANERGRTYNETLQGYTDLAGQYDMDASLVTRGLKPHQDHRFSTSDMADIRAKYNALRSQGMSAAQAKKQLGL